MFIGTREEEEKMDSCQDTLAKQCFESWRKFTLEWRCSYGQHVHMLSGRLGQREEYWDMK